MPGLFCQRTKVFPAYEAVEGEEKKHEHCKDVRMRGRDLGCPGMVVRGTLREWGGWGIQIESVELAKRSQTNARGEVGIYREEKNWSRRVGE